MRYAHILNIFFILSNQKIYGILLHNDISYDQNIYPNFVYRYISELFSTIYYNLLNIYLNHSVVTLEKMSFLDMFICTLYGGYINFKSYKT